MGVNGSESQRKENMKNMSENMKNGSENIKNGSEWE